MTPEKKLVARRFFRCKVHESNGIAYQDLVERVLCFRYDDFIKVRPYGNVGDRKNDGYHPAKGVYYQIYAPRNPSTQQSGVKAARKAAEDFEGLLAYWGEKFEVKEYRFAYNDKYDGSPPPLEEALSIIERSCRVKARSFLASHLEDEALSLPEDQLMDILGAPIPDLEFMDSIDFSILRDVIEFILKNARPLDQSSVLEVPDFGEKIEFNGLSSVTAPLLTYASYQQEAVADYFSMNSNFAKQNLRDHLATEYLRLKAETFEQGLDKSMAGDTLFFELLQRLCPSKNLSASERKRAQDCVLVVMAFR